MRRFVLAVSIPILSFAQLPSAAAGEEGAICVTIQRGAGHGEVEDAQFMRGQPALNLGAAATMSANAPSGAFDVLRFDLSAIPAGAPIASARLTLTEAAAGSGPIAAYALDIPWSEATVTSASFPEGSFGALLDAGAVVGSTVQFDVTAGVSEWFYGAQPNNGLILAMRAGGTRVFHASEAASPAQRPSLEVCYWDFCAGVTCEASDACHLAGTCDPATGACTSPNAPSGTACPNGTCLAGACVDGTQSPPYANGTRLHAQVWDGGDGAVSFERWWDTQLDVPCTFQYAGGGTERCLPPQGQLGFIDPDCTQPVIGGPEGVVFGAMDWNAHVFYRAGAPIGEGEVYTQNPDGTCTPSGNSGEIRAAVATPLTTFVAVTRTTEMRGPRLIVDVLHGADGSVQQDSWFRDAQTDTCTFIQLPSGEGLCLPDAPADVNSILFDDAACSEPITTYPSFLDKPATAVVWSGYQRVSEVHAVGAALDPSQVYAAWPPGAACTSIPNGGPGYDPSTDVAYALEPIPPGQYASTTTVNDGAGRLRARYQTVTGTERLTWFGDLPFHDTQLGSDCGPAAFGDGHTYCVPSLPIFQGDPSSGQFSYQFADDACTQPVVMVPDPQLAQLGVILTSTPLGVLDAYSLGPAPTAVYASAPWNGGACTPLPWYPLEDVRVLGSKVSPGTLFAPIGEVIE